MAWEILFKDPWDTECYIIKMMKFKYHLQQLCTASINKEKALQRSMRSDDVITCRRHLLASSGRQCSSPGHRCEIPFRQVTIG